MTPADHGEPSEDNKRIALDEERTRHERVLDAPMLSRVADLDTRLLFQMDSIAESVELNTMWRKLGAFTDFWFIGGNGGLETIGFDLRSGPTWPLVMIDCIAGDDSAERIAVDMADFIERIGLASDPEAFPPLEE